MTGHLKDDVRYAARLFRRGAGITLLAVVPLAFVIGANAAVFSVINALLLRPLPVRAPHELALLTDRTSPEVRNWEYPIWDQFQRRANIVQGAIAWSPVRLAATSPAAGETVQALWVSGRYLDVLGIEPRLGRGFSTVDDRRGGGDDGPVAVISDSWWRRDFGGTRDVIGKTMTLERVPFTIVGVTPPGFTGGDVGQSFDVLLPFGTEPLVRGAQSELDRQCCLSVTIMARLKPGQSLAEAASAVQAIQPQIRDASLAAIQNWRPRDIDQYLREPFAIVSGATGNSAIRLDYRRPLLTLVVVAALVLLVACANISNLLLARGAARRQELQVRLAMGATPGRLVRQLLTESAVLALFGVSLGLAIAHWAIKLLVHQLSAQLPELFLDTSMDWRVLSFGILLGVIITLLCGTAPALRARRIRPQDLHAGGRDGRGERAGPLNVLVVAQVGLSFVLIVGAALFIQTFRALTSLPLGVDLNRVLMVDVNTDRTGVSPVRRGPLFDEALEGVRNLPGVAQAALSFITPVSGVTFLRPVDLPGMESLPERERMSAINLVSPKWFETMGIGLVGGRDFSASDTAAAPPVVVVNQAFARRFLKQRVIGQTIGIGIVGPTAGSAEVVGLVGDAVNRSLRETVPPTMYFPLAQVRSFFFSSLTLNIRGAQGKPVSLTRSVAGAIVRINPGLQTTFRLLADQVDAVLTRERLLALLAGFFGVVSLILTAVGVFGLTAYSVARRRREMGIRLALGATPYELVQHVLVRVLWLTGVGLAVGAVVGLWASQFAAALLFDLTPRDPATFASAAVLLGVISAVAGTFAASTVLRTNPADALKDTR